VKTAAGKSPFTQRLSQTGNENPRPETAAQRPAAAFSAAFAAPRYSAKFSPAVIFRIDFIFILC